MMQDVWNAPPGFRPSKSAPTSPTKPLGVSRTRSESFHPIHKVPVGDSPYVRAKNVQRYGRLDDQIALLKHKLYLIQQGLAFNGKRTKTARSQGKKFQVSVEQEATRLLGNLGWALMQQNNHVEAEDAYRRALSIAPYNNKMCNLGICLMKQGRITEAKGTLRRVKPAVADGPRGVDSHLKAYERAQQMLKDLESEMMNKGVDLIEQSRLFDAFLSSSSIWQPQPYRDTISLPTAKAVKSLAHDDFADENINSKVMTNQMVIPPQKSAKTVAFNIDAPPFYSSKFVKEVNELVEDYHTKLFSTEMEKPEIKTKRLSPSSEEKGDKSADLLPDSKDFEEAIIAAVLEPGKGTETTKIFPKEIDKWLKVFQDITLSLSPRA
ncbi:Protein POLLENLESS 3-LIKE 2 [Hibiscus syriacus]|uniref:Protein POLLENLESS 3-LIKE 2 n=1 Tax=Hibiscus syriacus TaxID=106335 RepID=A0A6A3ASU3_HIBSY|nr:Protein POLLENLESS 3-LIKE 2 [Hibiscus syriacus]